MSDSKAAGASTNRAIARHFEAMAECLEAQHANAYRVQAYRRGATVLRELSEPVADRLARGGHGALIAIPGIGEGLAAAIEEIVHTGRLLRLERLMGAVGAERRLTRVKGIGPELARRIQSALHIETLEDLESAAYDGRLAKISGVGPERLSQIRLDLERLLTGLPSREARAQTVAKGGHRFPVWVLLEVDALYRTGARLGRLPKVAPRRFNPTHQPWLPVLHTERAGAHFTAMFSNTPLSHQQHREHDWVVVHYEKAGIEVQSTVVTEFRGPLRGRRVVRGREAECFHHYQVFDAVRPIPHEATVA